MSTAVCTHCKQLVKWRAQRGIHLSDLRCPLDGAMLEAYRESKHRGIADYAGWAVWAT